MTATNGKMNGKVCMITGASSGIGKATVLGLAKLGVTVVMVCLDQRKGEMAQAEIVAESGNESVEVMQVRDVAILIAIGANQAGKRQILGVSVSISEAEVHWRHFLQRLLKRGLVGSN